MFALKRTSTAVLTLAALGALALAPGQAEAKPGIGQLLKGLVNVNVSDIDVTVVDVVDITDSLNDNQIEVLSRLIENSEVASDNQNFLNDLLRNADIIDDTQVVVGVLGGAIAVLTP